MSSADLLRNLTHQFAMVPASLQERVRFQLALERIDVYLEAATTQVERIRVARADPGDPRQHDFAGWRVLGAGVVEAHFYFIAWDSIHKLIESLRRNEYGFRTPREVLRRHGPALRHYSAARDHLEHYNERLPGGARGDWRSSGPDFIEGSIVAFSAPDEFAFQSYRWDVGADSLIALRAIVDEFYSGLNGEISPRFTAWLESQGVHRSSPAT